MWNNPVTRRTTAGILAGVVLAGCATRPDNISPSYVSPAQYQSFDCDQLAAEMRRLSARAREVSGAQQSEASKDAVALGIGLVLFWPALFFMIGDDKEDEIARLKGEYDATEQQAVQKDCGYIQTAEPQTDNAAADDDDATTEDDRGAYDGRYPSP